MKVALVILCWCLSLQVTANSTVVPFSSSPKSSTPTIIPTSTTATTTANYNTFSPIENSTTASATSTTSSATTCSNVWSDSVCDSLVGNGLCSNPDVMDVCCGSCGKESLEYVMCGFTNPLDDRDQCRNLTIQHCQTINVASNNCVLLPEDHFNFGEEKYLFVEVYTDQRLHYSLHSDPKCSIPFSTLDAVSQLTVFGECTEANTSRGVLVGFFQFFKKCQQDDESGEWTCFGDELPCYHWTRQREDRCALLSDLSFRPKNLCNWNEEFKTCTGNWQQAVCNAIRPPQCNLSFCEFDPGSGVCVLKRNACACTTSNTSGGINVTHSGCSIEHSEDIEEIPICYVEGGAAANDLCTCVRPSTVFPGAGFRTCASYGSCNTLSVTDTSGTLTGYYAAVDDLSRPYGCTPFMLYRPVLIGFNTHIIRRFLHQSGFPPDNFLFSGISPYWIATDISTRYSANFDNTRVLLTLDSAVAIKEGSFPPNVSSDLEGSWISDVHSSPSNVQLSVTCSPLFPCLHPRWNLIASDFVQSPLLSRLELLRNAPSWYERVRKGIYSRALVNMFYALWQTRGSVVHGFLTNITSSIPSYSTEHPHIEVSCSGFSRADESITFPQVGFSVEKDTLHTSPTFSLQLVPFSVFVCRTFVSGATCAPNSEITAVFITPSEAPLEVPLIALNKVTETCLEIRSTSSSTAGVFTAFKLSLSRRGAVLSVEETPNGLITFCNLDVATSYEISARIINDVGEGPPAVFLASTLDGVPVTSVHVSTRRISPTSTSLSWPVLTTEQAAGDVQFYGLLVFSSILPLPEFTTAMESVNLTEVDMQIDFLVQTSLLNNKASNTLGSVEQLLNVSHMITIPDDVRQEDSHILGKFERSFLLDNLSDARVYAFTAFVVNNRHAGPFSEFSYSPLYVEESSSSLSQSSIFTIVGFATAVVIMALLAAFLHWRFFTPFNLTPLSDYILDKYYIVDKHRVVVMEEFEDDDHFMLSFGRVELETQVEDDIQLCENASILDGLSQRSGGRESSISVVIKNSCDPNDQLLTKMLCNETVFLDQVSTSPHFVELLAVNGLESDLRLCTDHILNTLFNYLRLSRGSTPWQTELGEVDLYELAVKASHSIVFLSQQGIVHKNIQSRNYFINAHGNVVLGNFTVAQFQDTNKNDYVISYEDTLAVVSPRWMAPECVEDRIFSVESDLYSFGVVIWEIFSFGRQPWAGHKESEAAHTIIRGIHLDKPARCSHRTYKIMLSCWKMTPSQRPTAYSLNQRLQNCWKALLEEQGNEKPGPSVLSFPHESDVGSSPSPVLSLKTTMQKTLTGSLKQMMEATHLIDHPSSSKKTASRPGWTSPKLAQSISASSFQRGSSTAAPPLHEDLKQVIHSEQRFQHVLLSQNPLANDEDHNKQELLSTCSSRNDGEHQFQPSPDSEDASPQQHTSLAMLQSIRAEERISQGDNEVAHLHLILEANNKVAQDLVPQSSTTTPYRSRSNSRSSQVSTV
eukprot:m.176405 g.176405  ORF g.176405 m.176405 type:complete len:1487 (+) comp13530_c0_seq1:120-4580(+)